MRRLLPEKLHLRMASGTTADKLAMPRRYTLTHSDSTGDLFLTVGREYDKAQISSWYTRLMRDEVLAEWRNDTEGLALHVHCHVSGGVVLGPAYWRYQIFRRELPLVLEAFRCGDRGLLDAQPHLDQAPIKVRFHAATARHDRVETWGTLSEYA